jgi:NAD(P)H-dependent flavin oxidoreductase YrpB (nitropropane dioxygenase family)
MAVRTSDLPRIIQGGMGVGISGWKLAQAVSSPGQLGVVAGTAFKVVQLEGTVSDDAAYQARPRICDLGYYVRRTAHRMGPSISAAPESR